MNNLIQILSLGIVALVLFSFASCKTKNYTSSIEGSDKMESTNILRNTAPVIVYKTSRNFNDYVPVIMNREKTEIVSYPDHMDVTENQRPTNLMNGYLLDNKGINQNVVFLNYTYDAYENLEKTPSKDILNTMILEKNPLIELYYCGNRSDYKDLVPELNILIENGFVGCKKADVIPFTMEIKAE